MPPKARPQKPTPGGTAWMRTLAANYSRKWYPMRWCNPKFFKTRISNVKIKTYRVYCLRLTNQPCNANSVFAANKYRGFKIRYCFFYINPLH